MNRPDTSGFTLVELAITLVVLGIILTFSIPAYISLTTSDKLRGATENLAAQLRLAREKAIATAVVQPMHFVTNSTYHIHYPSGIASSWTLPNRITFTPGVVGAWYSMQVDGRCNASGSIVLQDDRGKMDTVSVQMSGMVLTK